MKEMEEQIKTKVSTLLGTGNENLGLDEIQENSKVIESELLKKRAKKRRDQGKGHNEILSSSESEDGYFRDNSELSYANIEWKNI